MVMLTADHTSVILPPPEIWVSADITISPNSRLSDGEMLRGASMPLEKKDSASPADHQLIASTLTQMNVAFVRHIQYDFD